MNNPEKKTRIMSDRGPLFGIQPRSLQRVQILNGSALVT